MHKYLFNFISSYSGGGLKRLEEFSKWFDVNGGATFLINEKSNFLVKKFPQNEYIIPNVSKIKRLFNSDTYLDPLIPREFLFYYSYSIPIKRKVAKTNILHISNVLPFINNNFGYGLIDRYKFKLLRKQFFNSFKYIDVLAAESEFSLTLFEGKFTGKKIVLKNGSDEEIDFYNKKELINKKYENYAIVLGTHIHKSVSDSYSLFKILRTKENLEKLLIIGHKNQIPKYISNDPNVVLLGITKRDQVMHMLSKAKVYISTTKVENSFNAASEAVFLAEKSYISAIQPHLELVKGMDFQIVSFNKDALDVIEIHSNKIDIRNLEKWDNIIMKIINLIENV